MTQIDLEQDTALWHDHRINYINASEVATIMNLNPFESSKKLLQRKIFQEKIPLNGAMKHGKRLEKQARMFFNQHTNLNFDPIICVKEFMSASLDGWNHQTQSILEIKCPISLKTKTWQEFINENKIPIIYYAQIQAQMYCSEAKKAYFLVYQSDKSLKIKEIEQNKIFIKQMLIQTKKFYDFFKQTKKFLQQVAQDAWGI